MNRPVEVALTLRSAVCFLNKRVKKPIVLMAGSDKTVQILIFLG